MPFALTLAIPRLYAILDVDVTLSRGLVPLDVLDAWLDAGVRLVQVRAKNQAWSGGPLLDLAEQVLTRARPAGATVIVNDRADVARLAKADGVHVGQDDLTPSEVRAIVGPEAVVGLSTHSTAQVDSGCREPVNYLAIGPVYRSATRMAVGEPIGEAGVAAAVARARPVNLPVVGIGGITLENAPRVIAAGASSVAVISALIGRDPRQRARQLLDALSTI
ncbi:MAG TPA: thiamine phosphate synthase [Vicinamibacterales bacterium]|nr:thiamine phosphate synthase [Vicinamibacterales bacterium]